MGNRIRNLMMNAGQTPDGSSLDSSSSSSSASSSSLSPLLLQGSLSEKKHIAKDIIRMFGASEWYIVLEHVDEVSRSCDLEPLYPRDKDTIMECSPFFQTPRLNERILAIFYLCGGERILQSPELQKKMGLTWLLENKIVLNVAKV